MLMHWERIEALIAVAESGGFSAAARRLGKTQSAVSQAVAQLERELGQALLLRQRGEVRPTQAGVLLLVHARRAADEMAQARAQLVALNELQTGRLTIATTDTLACYFLPPALLAFRKRYPQVDVVLRAAPSPKSALCVPRAAADLAVVTLPLPSGTLSDPQAVRLLPLQEQPDVAIVDGKHALACKGGKGGKGGKAGKRGVQLARLAQEPLLLLGVDTAGRRALEARFAAQGLALSPRMEMNSVELLKRLVELGFGVAVVPELSVQREVAQGSLHALRLLPPHGSRQVALVLPAQGRESAAARAFADVVVGTLG